MRLLWTRLALADLNQAQEYIARDGPADATAVAQRVHDAVVGLCENPMMGRPGQVEGTREWVVTRTPYLHVYRVRGDAVEIVRLWHGRQNWQSGNP